VWALKQSRRADHELSDAFVKNCTNRSESMSGWISQAWFAAQMPAPG
jgi:hypothetical protein